MSRTKTLTTKQKRRLFTVTLAACVLFASVFIDTARQHYNNGDSELPLNIVHQETASNDEASARQILGKLAIKGRAPKTGYSRDAFSGGWGNVAGCDLRNIVLQRDMQLVAVQDDNCTVTSGVLHDPYTGNTINFVRGPGTSNAVQIDHVVAVSDAWQKGAQSLSADMRYKFYNDPLNLLAVDGPANQQKGDSDAATWLPSYKPYRCAYVARQIAVKHAYSLWVTQAEYNAMDRVLSSCPGQPLPIVDIVD